MRSIAEALCNAVVGLFVRPVRVDGDIAYVPLTQGYEAVIDAADVPLVQNANWSVQKDGRNIYAKCNVKGPDGRYTVVQMQRVILRGAPRVDHRDGDGLNNRRGNLRAATQTENTRNRRSAIGSGSQYLGVHWERCAGKWRAQIRADGKKKHLGLFADEVEAAKAYDAAALEIYGEFARPNFPETRQAPQQQGLDL